MAAKATDDGAAARPTRGDGGPSAAAKAAAAQVSWLLALGRLAAEAWERDVPPRMMGRPPGPRGDAPADPPPRVGDAGPPRPA